MLTIIKINNDLLRDLLKRYKGKINGIDNISNKYDTLMKKGK